MESRKNQIQGMTMRLAYEMPVEGFSLKGGLQLGGLKFRQEYIGDVSDRTAAANSTATYRDNYNGVHDLGGMGISPFVGVSIPVLKNNLLEFNLVGLSYKAAHYKHVAGTVREISTVQNSHTDQDYIKESGRILPHIEVAFGFRF
jgi:hypothetical protein